MLSALFAWLALLSSCAHGPPIDTTHHAPLRVVVISDLNSSYGSTDYEPEVHDAIRRIREEWRPDLVLAAGDLIAGQRPSLSDAQVRAMWTAFDAVVRRPLADAGIPFGFTLGNHDASASPAHARDRALALEYWRSPDHPTGLDFVNRDDFPFNYSFALGGVFVLVWDATHAGLAADAGALRQAEKALQSDAARQAALRIAIGHLPLYAVAEGRNRTGEVLDAPEALRDRLERHGVHTYISGHHHAYYPGRRGRLELLHAGALGQGARTLLGSEHLPAPTVTLLDIRPADGSIAYTTYTAERTGHGIDWRRIRDETLPRSICGISGCLMRRDLLEDDAGGPTLR
jgi:hypothetical protein